MILRCGNKGHQSTDHSLLHGIRTRVLPEDSWQLRCDRCPSQTWLYTETFCTWLLSGQGLTLAYKWPWYASCCLARTSESIQSCTGKKIAVSSSVENGERGLIALEDINPHEILISVPFADTVYVTEVTLQTEQDQLLSGHTADICDKQALALLDIDGIADYKILSSSMLHV